MAKPDLALGYIAVQLGYILPEHLEKAVEVQKRQPNPIGQILVQLGLIDERTLEKLLVVQEGGVSQVMARERKTLYVCLSCDVKFKIVDANPRKKYVCKYCKAPVHKIQRPQTLHKASTEHLEFTDESEMPKG